MSQPGNQMRAETPDYAVPPIQPSTPEPEPARLGPLQRLIGTLFSPSEAFQDVNRKPTWLLPMLIIMAIAVAFTIFLNSQTDEGWHQFMRERMKNQPDQLEMGVKFGKWMSIAASLLLPPIALTIVAGVFALVFMFMQAQTTFKKILSVIVWSACGTGIVQTIVNAASLLARDPESLNRLQPKDFGNISATNLGVALPSGTSPALVALAASFDIFTIWFLILMILGFTAISGSRRITRGKMAAVVVGLWLVTVLIKVGAAAAFPQQ